jgi:hypothetical protein
MSESESGDEDVEMIQDPPITSILSFVGPTAPWEETMADMMAMFFVGQNCSVDSYVYVPDCAESVMWLAKYTNKRHKHYEKKMVPSTACVKRLISDVVLVSCHASPRDAHTSEPAVLLFHDGVDSVSVLGVQQGTPDALKIWSCSSYTDRGSNQTYTKPAGSLFVRGGAR